MAAKNGNRLLWVDALSVETEQRHDASTGQNGCHFIDGHSSSVGKVRIRPPMFKRNLFGCSVNEGLFDLLGITRIVVRLISTD